MFDLNPQKKMFHLFTIVGLFCILSFISLSLRVDADEGSAPSADSNGADAEINMAVTPEERDIDRFREQSSRMEEGDVDLLWVGDSITHFWETTGKEVFDKYYGSRKAMNFAISGDRTGHVIWRIQHSPMSKINPKMAVVMIGTNNVGHNSSSPAQTIEGIQIIVDMLRDQYPKMNILLLEVFPRGAAKILHAVAPEQKTLLTDKMCEALRYCTETEYIDFGHDPLTSIEFCAYMPKLKAAILSYNNISDLSPLENCPELYLLELFCCAPLSDLSPLAKCENLEYLNFSMTAVKDVSALYELPKLRLLVGARNEIPPEQIDELARRMPDCHMTFTGDDIHEVGWRKVEQGKWYDWYVEVKEIFGYARGEYSGRRY